MIIGPLATVVAMLELGDEGRVPVIRGLGLIG